jgi:nicotinate-nucleotide adenylyltransferase
MSDNLSPINMQIGLFFGSFNPIHFGHLAIANYLVEFSELEQVWFVVSPHNPFKNKSHLLGEYHRLELVNRAIDDDQRFRASSIEFNLPKPSYTIDTITYLKEQYPMHDFRMIMGMDQLASFHKWKNSDELREQIGFQVYPRPGCDRHELLDTPEFELVEAPLMEISSSFIRHSIREGKNISYFLHPAVWKYISEMGFYS